MKKLSSLIVWALLSQMTLGALAPTWSAARETTPTVEISDEAPQLTYGEHLEEIIAFDEVLQGRSTATGNRLDTFGLFDWEAPSKEIKTDRVVDYRNLVLRLIMADGTQEIISNAQQNLSLPQGRSSSAAQSVEILYQGEVLLKSRFPVQSVAFYRNYLVFLEPNSFQDVQGQNQTDAAADETGVQPLSFVDLKAYAGLLSSAPMGVGDDENATATAHHGTSEPAVKKEARDMTLPIFSVPLGMGSAASALQVSSDGMLVVINANGQVALVPADILNTYSEIQQTALDVTAALVDPKTYQTAGPAVEEAERYFLQAINLAGKGVPAAIQRGQAFAGRMTQSLLNHHASLANLQADPAFAGAVSDIQKFTIAQQKTSNRLRLLWQRLSLPKPIDGPKKIREALVMMVAGIRSHSTNGSDQDGLLREGALQFINNPYIKWGTGVAAAAVLGVMYQPQFSHFLYEALDVSRVVVHGIFGRVRGMGQLAWEASKIAFAGFTKPTVFYRAYLTPAHRADFIVGVTAYFGTALSMLALPFLPVNMWLLARDFSRLELPSYSSFREQGQGLVQSGLSFLRARTDAFINRQRQMRAQFLRDNNEVATERARAQGHDAITTFTPSDEAELNTIFADIQVKNRSWTSRCIDKVRSWKIFRKSIHESIEQNPEADVVADLKVESTAIDPTDKIANEEIHTFGSALRSFLYSTESIGAAAKKDVRGWNGFGIFRAAFLSPTMFFKMITTPNFYNVALGNGRNQPNEIVIPTELNGGLIGPAEAGRRVFRLLTFDKNLDGLHAWENKIMSVEKEVLQHAMLEGFRGLVRFIGDRGENLQALIRSGGIETMVDPVLKTLTATQRAFFQNYVDELVTRSMQRFLTKIAAQAEGAPALDKQMSLIDLKRMTLAQIDALQIESNEAEDLVKQAAQEGQSFSVAYSVATEVLTQGVRRLSTSIKYDTLGIVDPAHNRTMRQIQLTLQAMEKKDAMPRAIRAVLPQVLMKKSIGFLFTLVGLAGITSGVMQPLHHELFGPNSYFHLGRMPFVAGNLVGLFITLFEGIPHKLQRDSSHAAHFGAVPEGEDANRGLLSWYFKQTFKNPANSYVGNQKTFWQIFFGQLKPSLVMSVFAGLASLGRFDLDGFMTYIFMGAFNPTNGFDSQLEQGMEFASFYHLKDFPERFRNHPRVLEYLSKKQAGLRFWFAFWEKIWVDSKSLVLNMMTRMDFPNDNHQAFLRTLDPSGKTPTERAYEFLENWIRKPLQSIPGVNQIVRTCETALTNNYEDWQKVIPSWFRSGGAPRSSGHH